MVESKTLIDKLKEDGLEIDIHCRESVAEAFFHTIKNNDENLVKIVFLGFKSMIYSKRGIISEKVIDEAFRELQERSIEGRYSTKMSNPLGIFVFDYSRELVEGAHSEEQEKREASNLQLKLDYLRKYKAFITDFLKESDEQKQQIIENIDFVIENYPNDIFAPDYNSRSNNFSTQQFFLKGKHHNLGLGNVFQIFNFKECKTYSPDEEKKVTDALLSYHKKRRWDYDHEEGGKLKLMKNGELTDFEKQVYQENVHLREVLLLLHKHSKKIVCSPQLPLDADLHSIFNPPHVSDMDFNYFYNESKYSKKHKFLI